MRWSPAAAVKATNVDTGFSRSATTGNDGAYRIEYLPVGKYDVEVEMPGFKKFVQQNVVLAVDQTQALNVTLAVGASSQTVTVSRRPSSRRNHHRDAGKNSAAGRDHRAAVG